MINDTDWADICESMNSLNPAFRYCEQASDVASILERWGLTYADYEAEFERRNPPKFDERGYIVVEGHE